jgi:hypothetical protein
MEHQHIRDQKDNCNPFTFRIPISFITLLDVDASFSTIIESWYIAKLIIVHHQTHDG